MQNISKQQKTDELSSCLLMVNLDSAKELPVSCSCTCIISVYKEKIEWIFITQA